MLSGDDFEGRAPGTPSEEKTVNYIVKRFKEAGVQPGMPDGTFIQDVPVVGQITSKEASIEIKRRGRALSTFNYYNDFMAWPADGSETVDVSNLELVYVGYGIQAPEEDWDDFKGVDVKGKIILVKNNDPSGLEGKFKDEARLYYGRYGYKYEKAKELGAAGVFVIHTTPSAGYPWRVVSNSWSRERFNLPAKGSAGETKINGWLTQQASASIFEAAGLNLMDQLDAAENQDFKPVVLKNLSLGMKLSAQYRNLAVKNVVGYIEGSDPELKDEYVVLSAHHDHLGRAAVAVDGDDINNGALDNASGVSAMLNMAEAYSMVKGRLRRSILLVAVGAEEVGLLGSQYFAQNPTVHPGKMAANLNFDGLNVFGRTSDMVVIGKGRSNIDEVLNTVTQSRHKTVKPDQYPDRGYYYRSDHFSFAKIGVPALFPNRGVDFVGKPDGYATDVVKKYEDTRYHNVGDEITDVWDLSGAEEDMRILFRVGYLIANDDRMRQWYAGDEFAATRQKMIEEAN